METPELSYESAMKEVETIVAGLERGEYSVDTLAANVKRASELIALCQGRLRGAEKDLAAILGTAQADQTP